MHKNAFYKRPLSVMNITMKGANKFWIQSIIFIVALLGLFFFFGLEEIFFSGPQGIHFMRQTDSLSFASKYFDNGYHFFKPQLYNLKNIDGNAACEFPITYYLTALLYSVFGKKVFILKLLHFIIVNIGVFCIFKLAYQILQDYFYAVLISLLLFTSTVFNYYSFNYLPDAPALGLTFIGWFFYFRYQIDKKKKTVLTSFLFFTLGSLIKVTYLINPLAIVVFSIFSILFRKKEFIHSANVKKTIAYGILGVMIVVAWNAYMIYYNALYDSVSFNTKALPIWDLSKDEISIVWDHIVNYWYSKYFANSSFHLLFIILPFQLIFYKKANFKLSLITITLFFGSLAYFILFYSQFKDHDYYSLAFLPFIVLAIINGIKTLQNISNKTNLHIIIKLIMSIVVIAGINYSKMKLSDRYENINDIHSKTSFLIDKNSKAIEKLNIPHRAKFIVAPDLCQNGGLFFLNRMGWNIKEEKDIVIDKINHYQDLGADYLLLISDEHAFLQTNNITGELILKGKGIEIYKLKNTTDNKK